MLGSLSGDDAFTSVRGVAAFEDGGIAVGESSQAQLWLFDAGGDRVGSLGDEGDGPGEFRTLHLVSSPDTLWAIDGVNRSFVTVAMDGTVIKEGARGRAGPLGRPLAVVGEWVLAASQVLMPPTGSGLQESSVTFLWENLADGTRQEIAVVPIVASWVSRGTGPMPSVTEIPFSTRPIAARYGGGAALVRGDSFRIEVYDLDGGLLSIMYVDAPRTPVTVTALEDYVEWYAWRFAVRDPSSLSEMYAEVPLPDSLPGFDALIEDSAGYLWAQIYSPDRRTAGTWVVFDRDGRALGTVETPPGLEVHQIGRDFVLGSTIDTLGVPLVRRHSLVRQD